MRKEIGSLKQQLADSLGDMAKDYWNALQDFLVQKTTKQEFDNTLMTLFTTPQQATLHNKLIYTILTNTTTMAPLPKGADHDFSAQNPRKRQQTDHVFGQVLKKRFNTKIVLSLTPQERSRLNQLQTVPEIQDPLPEMKGMTIPKSCLEESDFPTLEQLRSRIKFQCAYHGLENGFEPQVVELLDQSVQVFVINETYIKGLISNAIAKTKKQNERARLTAESLAFAVQLATQKVDVDLVETLL